MGPDLNFVADRGLHDWARWMRAPSDLREMWYPAKSAGFVTGGIGCWDDLEDECDSYRAQGVSVIVEQLEVTQKSAVYNRYLGCVFRGRPGVLEEELKAALDRVGREMIVRGLA